MNRCIHINDELQSLQEVPTEELEEMAKELSEFRGSRIDVRVSLRMAIEEEIERRRNND